MKRVMLITVLMSALAMAAALSSQAGADECAGGSSIYLESGTIYGAIDREQAQDKPQEQWQALLLSRQAYLIYGPIHACLLEKTPDQNLARIDIGNGSPLLWISAGSIAP